MAETSPPPSPALPPSRGKGASLLTYALAAAIVAADQASKFWILEALRLPERISVPVAGPLNLTMVWNAGVSFGLLRADHDVARWLLVGFSVVVAGVLAAWAWRASARLTLVSLGLVIGGAVGNAIDRARFGVVADFIDVSALGFFPWVFNVADSAITVGILLLVLDGLRPGRAD